MTPILFPENSTTFTSNGVGRLSDAVSCHIEEERNGSYELTMEYPSTGVHYEDIGIRKIICAVPAPGKSLQAFRIYNISKPINGKVTINAHHISYDLAKNTCMPFSVTASASACNTTLQGLKTNAVETCDFTFWTDVTTVSAYKQTLPSSIRKRLGGVDGSVLDMFGGEYEWDNLTVKLHKTRGSLKNIPLRYGKNITDIVQDTNIAETVTGIVPFWADQEGDNIVTLPEKAVYSSHASDYSSALTVPMDFSDKYTEAPSVATLRAAAEAYVAQTDFGVPKVSTEVNFIDLAETEEYKDILQLQHVYLCDTIPVIFEKLGISTTAKVVKVDFDVLKERYRSITVGSLRSDMSTTITDTTSSIASLAERTRMNFEQMDAGIDTAINNATAWLTSSGGYVIAIKDADGDWKELLFMDTADTQTAVHVLRINQNGIGFSSNGVNGPYTQAWTLDGKLVIGGTNVPSITVYDNNNNIIFKADATAMVWNASNSSMNSSGVITATGAQLTNANINGGSMKVSNANGYFTEIANGYIAFGQNNTDFGTLSIGSRGFSINVGDYILEQGHEASIVCPDFYVDAKDGKIQLEATDDIELNPASGHEVKTSQDINTGFGNRVYGMWVNTSGGISEDEEGGEIRFSDILDNKGGHATLNGDYVIIEANDIVVRSARTSGHYSKGYTGTFTLSTSGGGTATLKFVNGILV